MLKHSQTYTFIVSDQVNEKRLDLFIVEKFFTTSRSMIQDLIKLGNVTVNGKVIRKTGAALMAKDTVIMRVPAQEQKAPVATTIVDSLGVSIVYQSPEFAIIEKPVGLVTHAPSTKSKEVSLCDWLIARFADIKAVGYLDRPGIVHRLDKDTSGLMIVPLTAAAHATFSDMFKERHIHKTYTVLVVGHPDREGVINFPIARDSAVRNKMTHVVGGRESETRYKVMEYFENHSLMHAYPVTGRTHQIRVHFSTIGHALIGDTMYGTASPIMGRHALHASKLEFEFSGQKYTFESNLPQDFVDALAKLKPYKF